MKTTDKSTPRPWSNHLSGVNMRGYSQPFAIIENGKPNLIAGVFGDVKGGEATAKANAALIVKAVNEYEALLAFVDLVEASLLNEGDVRPIYATLAALRAKEAK